MKFIIETYGCQMNVYDSEIITSILINAGHTHTKSIDEADIIIFNTCSVREHAESRVLGRIANEVSRKVGTRHKAQGTRDEGQGTGNPPSSGGGRGRDFPSNLKPKTSNLIIGVVGCMAQRLGAELHKINNKIDFVVGVDQYLDLPKIIDSCRVFGTFKACLDFDAKVNYSDILPIRTDPLNAFVTIMRGCDNFCSYCIVPYTRGRERSRPIKDILKEIEKAGQQNAFDITLLGQNVNSYLYQNHDFADLLKKANEIDTIKRIRFVTSHPKDLSDKLIKTMASSEKVCQHIHLPMQSANDEILQKMNRGYTATHYKNLIVKLRKAIPDIAITTDVIAGFPGETEEQFLQTYNAMAEIGFDFAFMFKYSERSGTKACDYDDSVLEEIRLERLQRLINQQNDITTAKYKAKIGLTEEVYVENISKKDKNEMSGKTRDFKITVFKGNESLIGKFVKVKITDATGWTLRGNVE